ncbi:unnamed protein product [Plutella xylostella]|uniref:(diamondback moth) hypothetical protein n=1 Tax=Plutella xylostella TaxID=51655 RepID=A0A8S4D206_PLUXY|nr:unnamed protein product [Plutella xylostella]
MDPDTFITGFQKGGSQFDLYKPSRESSRDRLSNSGTLEREPAPPPLRPLPEALTFDMSNSGTLEREPAPPPLRPLPEALTFDMRNVQAMTDIKTEIGYARAWVRLSLEKKLLSKHLRELLADTTLLRSQYKRTAFLRCEEEREQFLYHLLTLNAVDYFCFTNTYPTTKLPYRVLILPSRKASQTTANCWVAISGAHGEATPKIPIPRNTYEFVFHHKNLGILSTLRIGHDNSGLSPRWLLDQVFVRNEVTGHTYIFPCNRWLGSGVDDGSTERLLVAQLLRTHKSAKTPAAQPTTPQTASTHLSTSTIQHMIGDCVNAIVKWHYQSKREKDSNSLSVLLCGENGLVKCLEQAFICGFKSARLFGKNLFIWDFFARVRDEFKLSLCDDNSQQTKPSCGVNYNCRQDQEHRAIWRCYCHLMDEVDSVGAALGKDGRFQLFICLSLRGAVLGAASLQLPPAPGARAIWRCYCHLMDEVDSVGAALGKDARFQLFICLSLSAASLQLPPAPGARAIWRCYCHLMDEMSAPRSGRTAGSSSSSVSA